MPKAVVTALPPPRRPAAPLFRPGGLIYEVAVRPFTMLHPEVPVGLRGTVAALAHPAVVEHLVRLGVDAVELMPMTAWIDERHLRAARARQRLGLQPGGVPRARPAALPRRHRRAAPPRSRRCARPASA